MTNNSAMYRPVRQMDLWQLADAILVCENIRCWMWRKNDQRPQAKQTLKELGQRVKNLRAAVNRRKARLKKDSTCVR